MTRTILIADDDLLDIDALCRVLKSARIQNPISVVRDGVETIAYLEGVGPFGDRSRFPYPALLFLDLRMPKISGVEVLEMLQENPLHRELGIVVFTAVGNVNEIRQAYQLGASSFLVKPVCADDFFNVIKWLKGVDLVPTAGGYEMEYTNSMRTARFGFAAKVGALRAF
jgi:CheY-like chemotaxis protein